MSTRCKRIVTETWVPGNRHAPDGPPREMRARCVLNENHEPNKPSEPHIFGDWLEVKRLGT